MIDRMGLKPFAKEVIGLGETHCFEMNQFSHTHITILKQNRKFLLGGNIIVWAVFLHK